MHRIKGLDYLKTIAILGVIFYHMGIVVNGYLGVEVFFVISGFLLIRGIKTDIETKSFRPLRYILDRVAYFWPLIAISGSVALIIGCFCMLPDDYENLAQSVVASNVFMNNVLQAITTKNYWDIVNMYKPLMHTWYIAVLLQSLIFLVVLLYIFEKKSKKDITRNVLVVATTISLILYLLPIFSSSDKFYYFPFRLFEIAAGCLIPYMPKCKLRNRQLQFCGIICTLIVFLLIFCPINIPGQSGLLSVVCLTVFAIYTYANINKSDEKEKYLYKILTFSGRYSYDFYIWHQIIIAFSFYCIYQKIEITLVIEVILGTIILSVVSVYIRKKIRYLYKRNNRIAIASIISVISTIVAFCIYINAGVVRDVPELGIYKNYAYRNMHAEYVDIPYSWNNDFKEKNKIHVLVLGDSFGRDFANIINESVYSKQVEISYLFGSDISKEMDRVEQADIVFYGGSGWSIPESLNKIPSEKLYIVGNKRFGNSNGIIYINRNKDWYFTQRVELSEEMIENNDLLRYEYKEHYIDMITPLLDQKNRIRVFTNDNFFISQDCRHLTKQGAQYYAEILDLDLYFLKD